MRPSTAPLPPDPFWLDFTGFVPLPEPEEWNDFAGYVPRGERDEPREPADAS